MNTMVALKYNDGRVRIGPLPLADQEGKPIIPIDLLFEDTPGQYIKFDFHKMGNSGQVHYKESTQANSVP